nr:glycyl-radical enzyme activating protein [uncultured Eisenbergiella sp.]
MGAVKGIVSDSKRMSVHDGPGIRTTLFLKGCPLRCLWCHNPENLQTKPALSFTRKLCISCGACARVCPGGLHSFQGKEHHIRFEACRGCGACTEECLPGALKLYGREMAPEEAARLLLEDKDFYGRSGGGVTFSGGEPLLQPAFLAEVMKLLKKEKIAVAVDTCGEVPWSAFLQVIPYTDLFLYDIKHPDSAMHEKGTGRGNERILENLDNLHKQGVPVEIRTPVIPGYNDDPGTLRCIASLLNGYDNITAWRLLPYHSMAKGKYEALGMHYPMPETPMPDDTRMRAIRTELSALFPAVKLSSD